MLSKHIENVRGRSEDYKKFYSLGASLLFTGVITFFWMFTWFIPSLSTSDVAASDNSASVLNAVDGASNNGSSDLSPVGVVKQEAGNAISTFVDSSKDTTDGTQDYNTSGDTSGDTSVLTPEGVITRTTKSGITVEAENPSSNVDINSLNTDPATSSGYDSSVDSASGN
ncbi:MAG: hypothetical protein WCO09_03015 [bacterium]